jgi:hypothetical protein
MTGFTILRILTIVTGVLFIVGVVIAYWRDSYGEYGWVALPIIFGMAFFIIGLLWGMQAQSGVACKNTAAQYGLPYQYSVSTPCLVFDDGRWIDIDKVVNNRESSS